MMRISRTVREILVGMLCDTLNDQALQPDLEITQQECEEDLKKVCSPEAEISLSSEKDKFNEFAVVSGSYEGEVIVTFKTSPKLFIEELADRCYDQGELLCLAKRNDSHAGMIGSPSGIVDSEGREICIGDTVTYSKAEGHFSSGSGIVAMFDDHIGIMGLATDPISQVVKLATVTIIKRYSELSVGDRDKSGYFSVKKFRS